MNTDWLSGAGGVVVGTILGFILSLGATWWQERRKKQELKHIARTLLRLEIDQNLTQLDDFWRNKVEAHLEGLSDELAFQRRMHLIQEPLPAWSHLMWESQASALPLALSEEEIRAAFHLHAQLERLTTLRAMLGDAMPGSYIEAYTRWREQPSSQRADISTYPIHGGMAHPFGRKVYLILLDVLKDCNQETMALWAECEGIRNELYSRKNPLPASTIASANLLVRLKGRLPGKRQHKQP